MILCFSERREKLERERAERERAERDQAERERKENERIQREQQLRLDRERILMESSAVMDSSAVQDAVNQHFQESLIRLASQKVSPLYWLTKIFKPFQFYSVNISLLQVCCFLPLRA